MTRRPRCTCKSKFPKSDSMHAEKCAITRWAKPVEQKLDKALAKLTDLCPKCGGEFGEHDGKKCPPRAVVRGPQLAIPATVAPQKRRCTCSAFGSTVTMHHESCAIVRGRVHEAKLREAAAAREAARNTPTSRSSNAEDRSMGNRSVVSFRLDSKLLERLDRYYQRIRSHDATVTKTWLVEQALRDLLQKEGEL